MISQKTQEECARRLQAFSTNRTFSTKGMNVREVKCFRKKSQFAMKLYSLLLILVTCDLIEANKRKLVFGDSGNFTPGLFFVENPNRKHHSFYIVPNITVKAEDDIEERKEILAFTCPASQDEIKKLKDAQLSKKNEDLANAAKALQSFPPITVDETDPMASVTRMGKSSTKELPFEVESESEDSLGSEDGDLEFLPTLDKDKQDKQDIYDNDYFFDLGKILNTLASKAEAKDIRWSPKKYFCQNDYRPQKARVGDCARFIKEDEYEGAGLYSISYRVKMMKKKKEVNRGELFVYAKCFKRGPLETIYVMYKIIPSVSAEEPKQIDYEIFNPAKIYSDYINDSYLLKIQKNLLKELDDKIQDDVIPQRLIPVYSIAEDYAKGTVANDWDIFSPQWRSKAKIWDELSRQIFNHGKKLKWIIYTETFGTLSTSKGTPMEVKMKGYAIGLSIPRYWWTLIMKTDGEMGEGIIIGMLNYPKTIDPKPPKNINRLCDTTKSCADFGWADIINETNADYVDCCEVIGTTARLLIAYPLELNVLSLNAEKINETEQTRVRVDNLTTELFSIRKKYLKWKDNNEKLTGSPVSTPSNSNREDPESINNSPLDSPDRESEISSPRLGEANELLTKTKSNPSFRKIFSSKILPGSTKSIISRVRSPVAT